MSRSLRPLLLRSLSFVCFAVTPVASAQLSVIQTVTDGVGLVDGIAGVRHLEASPDGRHLYATGNQESAIAVFSIDSVTGALSFEQVLKDDTVGGTSDGLQNARFCDVSPDGENVYVASYNEFAASSFARDLGLGTLTFLNEVPGPGAIGPFISLNEVAVSPDGNNVYAVSNSVTSVLARGGNGSLTYLDSYDNANDGFGPAFALAVSPDGAHVYVADGTTLSVAARGAGGGLTFVTEYEDNLGVDGLDGTETIALSPDGLHLYVGAYNDSSIAHFTRNPSTGALAYQATYVDLDVCPDPNEILMLEDGSGFVVSCLATLAIYTRDVATGELTGVLAFTQEELGASQIYSTAFVGSSLYVASELTHSILVLPEPAGVPAALAALAAVAATACCRAKR